MVNLHVGQRMRTRRPSSFVDLDELAAVENRWTRQQVEVFQLTQLRRTIRIAETFCPFYAQRFADHGVSYLDLHTAEDMALFPVLTQQDVTDHRDELTIKPRSGSSWARTNSGEHHEGSLRSKTARGTPPEQKEQVFVEQMLRRAGKQANHRTLQLGDGFDTGTTRSRRWLFDIRRKSLHLSTSDLSVDTVDDYIHRLEKFRPHFIVAYPSALLMLALHIDSEDSDLHHDLQAIICTDERLDSPQRAFLEKVFKTDVLGRYVQPERVVLASQIATSDLYHFSPGYGYAELDEPGPTGMCEVLGTSFHHDSMPLVRYRTGDLTPSATSGSEDQSFPWLTVPGFVGRTDEFLVDTSGKRVWPVHLSLDESPFKHIVAIQFFQNKPGAVTMRFVASRGISKHEKKLLVRHLSVVLGKKLRVSVQQATSLPRSDDGKLPWVVRQLT